jgi:hypothetical protein
MKQKKIYMTTRFTADRQSKQSHMGIFSKDFVLDSLGEYDSLHRNDLVAESDSL